MDPTTPERRESDHLPHPEEQPPAPAEGRPPQIEAEASGPVARLLGFVEWLGNLLPHPVTLFALFALGVVVVSGLAAWAGLSVEDPRPGHEGEMFAVRRLLRISRILSAPARLNSSVATAVPVSMASRMAAVAWPGSTALVMAPKEDCFAVATPCSGEAHRSIYLSLLGRDIKAGQTATARSRLVIGQQISDEQALGLYRHYVAKIEWSDDSRRDDKS